MSDEQSSAPVADDTTATAEVPEDTKTSTNEEAQDTETDLEDIEITPEELDSEETEESGESKDEAATESEDTKEESKDDDSSGEDAEQPNEEVKEEDTTSDAAKSAAARTAFEQREAQRAKAKVDSQEAYLNEAEDNRDLALRQLQVDAYNNRVEGNNNKLQNGIDKAVAAIDLFQNGSPEVKEELATSLDDFERMYVQRDANGDPVQVTGDVYEYLQNKADSIRRLTGVGARKQQKDKANTKSRTMTLPAKTPKESAKDPLLDAFDEEASRP